MMQVFFDGSCPMCVREVAVYRRASPADIIWHDLSSPLLEIPIAHPGYQPSRSELLNRFHVYNDEGRWLHGAPAFICLWQRLAPVWRALASVGRLPGGLWLMDMVYTLFLKIRPRMQRWALHWFRPDELPAQMIASIRSDHAGETGAVWIYRSMLWLSRDPDLRPMLEQHLKQEQIHLDAMNRLLPWRFRSRLLALWVIAGCLTGAIPALFGRRWILGTIAAVERFVDRHYMEQIEMLQADASRDRPGTGDQAAAYRATTEVGAIAQAEAMSQSDIDCGGLDQCGLSARQMPTRLSGYPDLLAMLQAFRHDELEHRDEAIALIDAGRHSAAFELWCSLVGRGSSVAVQIAKVI